MAFPQKLHPRAVTALICALFLFGLSLASITPARAQETSGSCTALIPLVKDDRVSPPEWLDPASVSFGLGDAAYKSLPESLGPIPAGPAYMIGSTQESGVPWVGVNTMHPSLLENTMGDVAWELTGFSGPGAMYVFTQGNLGQVVGAEWFRGDGNSGEGSTIVQRNSHVHPNWVFSQPGTYQVQLTQTVDLISGETVSGTSTLTFEVGNGGGNANEGHFDFGPQVSTSADCSGGVAPEASVSEDQAAPLGTNDETTQGRALNSPAAQGATTQGTNGTAAKAPTANTKKLPETGSTVMTFPIAFLGLGFLALGSGLIFAIRKYNWR